jgi:hypothetical protein
MNSVVLVGLALLVTVNVAVSVSLVRAPSYERSQKLLQLLLIWCVPVLGAIFVWSFLRGSASERVTTDLANRDDGAIGYDHIPEADASDVGDFGGHGH